VNRAGGGLNVTPLDANKAKAFAARLKGRVLAFDQHNGKPAASAPARPQARPPAPPPRSGPRSPEPPPIDDAPPGFDDDIPF
jgi:hypothetical protein